MLRSLYIQNYALIEKLDIDFGSGFSVITEVYIKLLDKRIILYV